MTRRRIPGSFGDRVDVHRLVQDEALLTRLAHQQQPDLLPGDLASSPPDLSAPTVESFLADWRERTVSPELPLPPSAKAIQRAARAAGLSAPARSNSFRAAVGIVASVAFLLSGTAIAGARSARPGDVLWPVTRTFWADRAEATMARHDIDVALGRAAAALAAGDRDGADQALMVAAAALPRIPEDARGALQLRMQQVGAGMNASPAPAAQAAEPAGTPQAVPGPQARPGVPVVPVAASSTGGGSPTPPNAQASGIGAPGDQQADTSRSAPWMPGQGSMPPVTTEPAATEPESTQARVTVPGSPAGNGSAPTTGSSLSVPPATGSSPEQTSAVSTTAAASTPSDSTGPTQQPSTSADATSPPSSTAPSTVPTTGSPTASSTAHSTTSATASSTATTGPGDTTAPTTSSADSVSADVVPTSATPSRRTTRPPPGFAPPPLTTPASRTSATETSAAGTSTTQTSTTQTSTTQTSTTQTSAMETGAAETTAATVAR